MAPSGPTIAPRDHDHEPPDPAPRPHGVTRRGQILEVHLRHFDLEIETIEQRARHAAAVAPHATEIADAATHRRSVEATLASAGFTRIDLSQAVLRREAGAPVAGLVVRAQAA